MNNLFGLNTTATTAAGFDAINKEVKTPVTADEFAAILNAGLTPDVVIADGVHEVVVTSVTEIKDPTTGSVRYNIKFMLEGAERKVVSYDIKKTCMEYTYAYSGSKISSAADLVGKTIKVYASTINGRKRFDMTYKPEVGVYNAEFVRIVPSVAAKTISFVFNIDGKTCVDIRPVTTKTGDVISATIQTLLVKLGVDSENVPTSYEDMAAKFGGKTFLVEYYQPTGYKTKYFNYFYREDAETEVQAEVATTLDY